jgi:hypothetical protein
MIKKKLWKQLKDLGYKSKTEEASIVLNINNELCHDSKTIADFRTGISSKPVTFIGIKRTNSSVTGCKTSFLL